MPHFLFPISYIKYSTTWVFHTHLTILCDYIPHSLPLQHGITCIGFRDKGEKERFCHQLERVIRWLGEKAQKQKERVLEAGEKQRRGKEETDGPANE